MYNRYLQNKEEKPMSCDPSSRDRKPMPCDPPSRERKPMPCEERCDTQKRKPAVWFPCLAGCSAQITKAV